MLKHLGDSLDFIKYLCLFALKWRSTCELLWIVWWIVVWLLYDCGGTYAQQLPPPLPLVKQRMRAICDSNWFSNAAQFRLGKLFGNSWLRCFVVLELQRVFRHRSDGLSLAVACFRVTRPATSTVHVTVHPRGLHPTEAARAWHFHVEEGVGIRDVCAEVVNIWDSLAISFTWLCGFRSIWDSFEIQLIMHLRVFKIPKHLRLIWDAVEVVFTCIFKDSEAVEIHLRYRCGCIYVYFV